MDKIFNFNMYCFYYTWEEENFMAKFSKKRPKNIIYLHWTNRDSTGKSFQEKAKFEKVTGLVTIYIKCDYSNNLHKKLYYSNQYNSLNTENNISDINDECFDDNKNEIKIYDSINTDLENSDNFLNQIGNKSENVYKINDNDLFSISEKNSKDNYKDSKSENVIRKEINIENNKKERGVLPLFTF